MKFEITIEDYTIILNALHYYKKVDKIGNFDQYNDTKVNALRDKLAQQMVWYQGFIEWKIGLNRSAWSWLQSLQVGEYYYSPF